MILCAAGLAVAFSLAPGQAEVLAVNSTFAINGMATISDPAEVMATSSLLARLHFEVQSAAIVSGDPFDLDHGTLAVTVVSELSTWATTLLSLRGFGRQRAAAIRCTLPVAATSWSIARLRHRTLRSGPRFVPTTLHLSPRGSGFLGGLGEVRSALWISSWRSTRRFDWD